MRHVRNGIILHHAVILILGKIEAAIILKIRKNSLSRSFSRFAIRLIAESGLLYTLTSIAAFFTLLLSPTDMLILTSAIVCY